MVYRNNAGRLGSGFISVCLKTRWLGQKSGFYVPDQYCSVGRPCQPSFHWIKFWHVRILLPQTIRLRLSVLVLYWVGQGESSLS